MYVYGNKLEPHTATMEEFGVVILKKESSGGCGDYRRRGSD